MKKKGKLNHNISKLEDIKHILFQIFDLFPLNTKKHLDYLDFKKAYFMYVDKNYLNKQDVFSNIVAIKNSMNDQRFNFNLPENHVINITGNYLVGILEGALRSSRTGEAEVFI